MKGILGFVVVCFEERGPGRVDPGLAYREVVPGGSVAQEQEASSCGTRRTADFILVT